MKSIHAVIAGRVQGVGYRYSCREAAIALGVSGWVRNLPDGRVETAFSGDDAAVDALLAWCEAGPPLAIVESVETRTVASTDAASASPPRFEIR